jgi:lauroyl/myristoyl acyltransferase
MRRAIPDATLEMLRESLINVGQLFLEMPYRHSHLDVQEIDRQVQFDGWDNIEQALSKGNGLILLGPHAGSFESLGAIYTVVFLLLCFIDRQELSGCRSGSSKREVERV